MAEHHSLMGSKEYFFFLLSVLPLLDFSLFPFPLIKLTSSHLNPGISPGTAVEEGYQEKREPEKKS